MKDILLSWIGRADLRAPEEGETVGLGPLAQALKARSFDAAFLVTDYSEAEVRPYLRWLRGQFKTPLHLLYERLTGPTQFGEIYEAAVRACAKATEGHAPEGVALTFHLSPGTPAMAAVWIILAKTRFPGELIESSRQHGVQVASVPFDISADFIPDLLRAQDDRLRKLGEKAPEAPEFADIVHDSRVMRRLIGRAQRVAPRNVPVLVEGESGTGKEMLARAIHRASPRRGAPFVAVNCGAIPGELVESELFGHEKGAFTGANQARQGYFEAAHGGTLFLDEIGDLPGPAQGKLLRILQEGEVVRVGSTKVVSVDVRIIAATNRTLAEEIAAGRFREDLFYRLAVAVLKIPPLRERPGDVGRVIDHLLGQVNRESKSEPGFKDKKLSAGARNLLLSHPWPGNVREVLNTLRRAVIWSESDTMTTEDMREALLPLDKQGRPDILGRPLGGGLNLPDLLREVARHYLARALDEAGGNKTRAAELVGLPSYQTLTNWLSRYEVNS